jgi:hypothetical protein
MSGGISSGWSFLLPLESRGIHDCLAFVFDDLSALRPNSSTHTIHINLAVKRREGFGKPTLMVNGIMPKNN